MHHLIDDLNLHPILIDFGTSCKTSKSKHYSLTSQEKEKYRKYHWHIAPELISGLHSQSFASDVYSLGVLMLHTCRRMHIPNAKVRSVALECMFDNPSNRPLLTNVIKKLMP